MPLREEDDYKYYETLMEIIDVRREIKGLNTHQLQGKELTFHFTAK